MVTCTTIIYRINYRHHLRLATIYSKPLQHMQMIIIYLYSRKNPYNITFFSYKAFVTELIPYKSCYVASYQYLSNTISCTIHWWPHFILGQIVQLLSQCSSTYLKSYLHTLTSCLRNKSCSHRATSLYHYIELVCSLWDITIL